MWSQDNPEWVFIRRHAVHHHDEDRARGLTVETAAGICALARLPIRDAANTSSQKRSVDTVLHAEGRWTCSGLVFAHRHRPCPVGLPSYPAVIRNLPFHPLRVAHLPTASSVSAIPAARAQIGEGFSCRRMVEVWVV
jgi:hypothetical protein